MFIAFIKRWWADFIEPNLIKSNMKSKSFYKDKRSLLLIALSFIVAEVAYWSASLMDVGMSSSKFIMGWGIPGFLLGIIGTLFLKKDAFYNSKLVTLGFIASVIATLIYDVTSDSTSHNLWPFEIVITIAIILPASFLGAALMSAITMYVIKN